MFEGRRVRELPVDDFRVREQNRQVRLGDRTEVYYGSRSSEQLSKELGRSLSSYVSRP